MIGVNIFSFVLVVMVKHTRTYFKTLVYISAHIPEHLQVLIRFINENLKKNIYEMLIKTSEKNINKLSFFNFY